MNVNHAVVHGSRVSAGGVGIHASSGRGERDQQYTFNHAGMGFGLSGNGARLSAVSSQFNAGYGIEVSCSGHATRGVSAVGNSSALRLEQATQIFVADVVARANLGQRIDRHHQRVHGDYQRPGELVPVAAPTAQGVTGVALFQHATNGL